MGSKQKFSLILSLAIYIFSASPILAATIIVSPGQSIQTAVDSGNPGDTIYVRNGTYPSFKVTTSGAEGNYLTISGYNNEMPIITNGEGIELYNVSYVNVKGFEVTDTSHSWRGGITIEGGGHNIVDGNKSHDNVASGMSGIRIWNSSFNKIVNNDVYRNSFGGIDVTGDQGNSTDNEVGYNRSYNHTLSGGDSDGMGSNSDNNGVAARTYFHDNIVHDNSDDGIDTWNTADNIIAKNIVYNHRGPGDGNGIKIGGSTTGGNNLVIQNISYNNISAGFASNGNGSKFYNNVSFNNDKDGFNDGWRTPGSIHLQSEFINNIGMNNGRYNAYFSSDTLLSHHNIWYSPGNIKVKKDSTYTALADLFSATGLDDPAKSKSADPQFIDVNSSNFHLLSNSPAINSGDAANPGQMDVIDGIPDIGAYEYSNSVPSPSPSPSPKPGDANGDGKVDGTDYVIWLNHYNQSISGATSGDFNNSGKVDGIDYVIWMNNYGK